MLQGSGISPEDILEFPQALADVINFQLERQRSVPPRRSKSLEFDQ